MTESGCGSWDTSKEWDSNWLWNSFAVSLMRRPVFLLTFPVVRQKRKIHAFAFLGSAGKKKKNTQQVKALTHCNILFPSIGCTYGVFPQLQEPCDSLHNNLDQHMVPLLSVKGTVKQKKYIYIYISCRYVKII